MNALRLEIRPARASEAPSLTDIAFRSKGHWGYPDDWMDRWRPALAVTPAYIATRVVHLAEADDTPVGFYALAEAAGRWELEHLWVDPEYIGHGVGRALFRHAVARLAELDASAVLGIESDPNAESFYLKMGARRVREVTREWSGLTRTLPYLEYPGTPDP